MNALLATFRPARSDSSFRASQSWHRSGHSHSWFGSRRPARPARFDVSRGSPGDLPMIIAFLSDQGRRRQFFPVYTEDDFQPGSPLTRGFAVEDFLLARRDGKLVGVLGVWDRLAFKRTIVRAYRPPLRQAKPVYDVVAQRLGLPALPGPGEAVSARMVASPALRRMIRTCSRCWSSRPSRWRRNAASAI